MNKAFGNHAGMRRPAQLVLALALAAGALAGCAPVVLGGAAVGALVATDRRTSGAQLEDEGIELRSSNRLRDAFGDRAHINVTSYNRQVLLTGEVPNAQDKQAAERIVSGVDNVRSIVNELAVMPNTSLSQRANDSLISGKVKASFVDAKDLYANAFKVVTERGTVYLMGRVTRREAERATEITRGIDGVQKVVRLFEIISDEDLQRMLPTPPAAPASAPASAS